MVAKLELTAFRIYDAVCAVCTYEAVTAFVAQDAVPNKDPVRLPCTRKDPVISTSLSRDIGFEPVHLEETIPVNCEPSPLNEPVNDPVVYDEVNALNDAVVTNDPVSIDMLPDIYDAVKA